MNERIPKQPAITARQAMDRLTRILSEAGSDVAAVYMAMDHVRDLMVRCPEKATGPAIDRLGRLLGESFHVGPRQSYFLHRRICKTLADAAVGTKDRIRAQAVVDFLRQFSEGPGDSRQRAASEALGSFPLSIRGPAVDSTLPDKTPSANIDDIVNRCGFDGAVSLSEYGRSLVISTACGEKRLVVKMAEGDNARKSLALEAAWMHLLAKEQSRFPLRFDIPQPVTVNNSTVFRYSGDVHPAALKNGHDPKRIYALAFEASADYFHYPNGPGNGTWLAPDRFREVLSRNAWLLGRLCAKGFVHTAPIPLFHNRVQQERRTDRGVYHWWRGGRLDRWLSSCMYPNFGVSGIRDFEHFIPLPENTDRAVYRHVGSHLLSLVLVAGSYFRLKHPEKIGTDANGHPMDVRGLFDRRLLGSLVTGAFDSYHEGFVGKMPDKPLALDMAGLVDRMVEEMGVDRHMDEVFRAADQSALSDDDFRSFLKERGVSARKAADIRKGAADLHLATGPHLGGFNRAISLPELIEFVSAAAACCVSGRFLLK